MGKSESSDIILGILYASAAIFLFVASYMLYIKQFRRNKLVAVDQVIFTTSRYDTYKAKTQFLIELANPGNVIVSLLNANEVEVAELLNKTLPEGENVMEFEPNAFEDGVYYISLKTDATSILRKIKIVKD